MFIRALASISPQQSFGASMLPELPAVYNGNRLRCVEPDYKDWLDPKLIRRMSRIIKMGVATASLCLKNAGIAVPDAIVTGTAYGCLEDTGIFLNRMIEFNEEMLNPTAFIQSTHNTVGAQIALSVKCYGYNNTFVHRGFSFESALLDGLLLLKDHEASNVLIGATDELTDTSYAILDRFGIYRKELSPDANTTLISQPAQGTIAGEGSAFFLFTNEVSSQNLASLDAIYSFYKPADIAAINEEIKDFLAAQSLTIDDIDIVLDGRNGDQDNDVVYAKLAGQLFAGSNMKSYKQFCGEYPTSSSFGLWYAVTLLRGGSADSAGAISSFQTSSTGYSDVDTIASNAGPTGSSNAGATGSSNAGATGSSNADETASSNVDVTAKPPKKILVYNHYKNIHHSLFLVSAC